MRGTGLGDPDYGNLAGTEQRDNRRRNGAGNESPKEAPEGLAHRPLESEVPCRWSSARKIRLPAQLT